MLLQLCTIWLKGNCRGFPAYRKNSLSSRPPTKALSITAPLYTSWCGINCDHSSTARSAPPTLHDMAQGSLSCVSCVSKEFAIFSTADEGTFDHRASIHVLVRNQLRSFINGAECSSNFARYGSRVIVVRFLRIERIRYLLDRRRRHFGSALPRVHRCMITITIYEV